MLHTGPGAQFSRFDEKHIARCHRVSADGGFCLPEQAYKDPKTKQDACCPVPMVFVTDKKHNQEGRCCDKGQVFSYDATAASGGCCPPGQSYHKITCEVEKEPDSGKKKPDDVHGKSRNLHVPTHTKSFALTIESISFINNTVSILHQVAESCKAACGDGSGHDRVPPSSGPWKAERFPCNRNKLLPCTGGEAAPWKDYYLNWVDAGHRERGEAPRPCEMTVNFDEPVIASVVDIEVQAERYRVSLDGKVLGPTGGEDGFNLDHVSESPTCCLRHGFSRGFFLIPPGEHTLKIEWPQGWGTYKQKNGKWWTYGHGAIRFDYMYLCDDEACRQGGAKDYEQSPRLPLQTVGSPSCKYI
ncbi:hypothetical protein HIM_01806 [Hirsutella minnesotensis 3608]|nr:hypothetical protein HIM_01806 [Hirsutella minnesotensis 3608]